jgi:hypothetical protein
LRPTIAAFIALFALAAGLPVVAGASHKPGHNPGNQPALTIAASPNPTIFWGTTTISGDLKGPNQGGRTVTLRRDRYPYGDGEAVATTKTEPNGNYEFTGRPPRNTLYRTVVGSTRSPLLGVRVRIRVSLNLSDNTPQSGQLVTFSGRACPAHDGRTVLFQKRSSTGAWIDFRKTELQPAAVCSVYSRQIRLFRDNVWRALVSRDADHATGVSPLRTVDAHL